MRLLLALGLCACSAKLDVPSNAQIGCQSNADCPSDWSCNPNSQKCVSRSPDDFSVPSAANAAVTPAVGKAGTVFSVSFDAPKALVIAPKVDFIDGTSRVAFSASGNNLHYVAS